MWANRLKVIGSRQESEEDGVRQEVESWEVSALVVKVTHQRLEADFQLFVDVSQDDGFWHLPSVAALKTQNKTKHFSLPLMTSVPKMYRHSTGTMEPPLQNIALG
jgi:hypothetical protein